MNNKTCEFCDKRGVPILPLRYAVAPAGTQAPKADGPDIELPAKAAHYTRRLLRSGYLYVFDEARERWETYFVTPEAHFFKLAETPGVVPILPKKPFDCPDQGHRAVASCITIRDARNATKVWLGFSDVQWTDAVRARHAEPAYRKRHMRCVDVKAYAASADAKHCIGIQDVGAGVAEHALEPKALARAFGWSPFEPDARKDRTERMVQECERLQPGKGFAVALEDPAGVAQELAFLMHRNVELFMAEPAFKRGTAVTGVISQMEQAIRKQAELGAVASVEAWARQIEQGPQSINPSNPATWGMPGDPVEADKLRAELTPAALDKAGDNKWKAYAEKYDAKAANAWQASFREQLRQYDAQFIGPLAETHAQWMASRAMADQFECNYDTADIDTGVVYTEFVSRCIAGTQDKQACSDLYDRWLRADTTERHNLVVRAMQFNQESIVKKVDKATKASPDPRIIAWDDVFAVYGAATGRLAESARDGAARLVAQIGGPLARLMDKVADGTVKTRAAIIATGLVAGHPVVVREVIGSKKDLRAHLIRELTRIGGKVPNSHQLQRAVSAEIRRLEIRGVPMKGTVKMRWWMVADEQRVRDMPTGLTKQQRAQWLAKATMTPRMLEELNLSRWRQVISSNVRFGVVAGLLQFMSLSKLMEDEGKAMAHDRADAERRKWAGVAALGATTSEVIGHALAGRAAQGLKLGQGLASIAGRALQFAGRVAGLGAALTVAGLDIVKANQERVEGNHGLFVAYLSSAIVGASLAAAIVFSALLGSLAIPVIGVLVLLLVLITVLIEFNKDNPLQDWLERCLFGKQPSQRYPDFDTEQRELKLALGG